MICYCWSAGDAAQALSGRGGGYDSHLRHGHAAVHAQLKELDELVTLSAAQRTEVKAILQRKQTADEQAAAQIKVLLTEQQRKAYGQPSPPAKAKPPVGCPPTGVS